MHCTLDLELTSEITYQKNSALTALLTKARVTTYADALAKFRIQQSGISASTSMAVLAAKADDLVVTNGIWMMAEPVHLVLRRDAFSLYPEVPVKLSHQEAIAYQAILNRHFQSEGITFYIGRSGQWYVNAQNECDLSHFDGLTQPSHALGQSVDAFLPKQAEAKQWLQIQNEVQMLLYESAENQAREQAGQLAVNSVWFHGAAVASGSNEKVTGVSYMSNASFYHGLAAESQSVCEILPTNVADLESTIIGHDADAIVFDLTQVTALDAWLLAFEQLLKRRVVKHLRLNLGLPDKTLVADIKPIDLWRFWRKSQAVSHYIQ